MAPLLLIGAAIGGVAMYYLDPDKGRRRRALVRDKAVKASTSVKHFVDDGTRDLKNRGAAVTGRVKSLVNRRNPTDDVLAERVRSTMGRHVAHPGAIEVTASNGEVALSGSILAHERDGLVEAVRGVAGVRDVQDQLTVFETAEGISDLQGGKQGDESSALTKAWAPGTRLIGSAAGTTLTLYAVARSNRIAGFMTLVAGIALLARSTSNKSLLRLVGLEARERPKLDTGLVEDEGLSPNAPARDRFPEDTAASRQRQAAPLDSGG